MEIKKNNIPQFFMDRIIAWGVLVIVLAGVALFLHLSEDPIIQTMAPVTALIAGMSLIHTASMYHMAARKKFFVLRLTCTGIEPVRGVKGAFSFLNPSTSFQKGNEVAFSMEDGTRVVFTFESCRRFLVGYQYDFYFRKPSGGMDTVTTDMLEGLKIDHAIVASEIKIPTDANGGSEENE